MADATAEARREGIILSQQDIALIRQRLKLPSAVGKPSWTDPGRQQRCVLQPQMLPDNFVRTGKFSFSELAVSIIAGTVKIGMQNLPCWAIADRFRVFSRMMGCL